jgi:hydroxylaminobenzene mutase
MSHGRNLLRLGITLFLLGLLTGLVVQEMRNPRAGLAAHLEGLMNGMFLMIAGLVWKELALGPRAALLTYRLLAFGTFANWATTTATAILGTSRATPIAGVGHGAGAVVETAVLVMLALVTFAMIGAVGTIAARLWRTDARRESPGISPAAPP